MKYIENVLDAYLTDAGVDSSWILGLRITVLVFLLILVSAAGFWITKKYIVGYIYRLVRRTSFRWDDMLADKNVLNNLAHLVPAIIVKLTAPHIFSAFPSFLVLLERLTDIYLLIVVMTIIFSILKIAEAALSSKESLKDKPVSSYIQLVKIIIYIIGGILILSLLLDKTPVYFLSAFGAMTAILLLIFKDTILGLVASVQMSANDMIRVGDWVEMPKFNADGDVLAINLNTVKVQNFDKTITTVPTYYFITESFKNWRGMRDSGGRRIKRSFFINTDSIRFLDPKMREEYKAYRLVRDYITERQEEIVRYNAEHNIDDSVLINGRRMTNIGLFRVYIQNYLQTHPNVAQDMTIMVRQLAIESKGVPIEVYCFANTTVWTEYENIQADIFDHILAAARFFEIDIFQEASSKDFSRAFMSMQKSS